MAKKWVITRTISYDVSAEVELDVDTPEEVMAWFASSEEAVELEFESGDGQDETVHIQEVDENE